MVRTDNGPELQAKFHWHLMDLGINHAYIKKSTPRFIGGVRSLSGMPLPKLFQKRCCVIEDLFCGEKTLLIMKEHTAPLSDSSIRSDVIG
jgi:hypothetical protein